MPLNYDFIFICSKILFPQLIRKQGIAGRTLSWQSGDPDLILLVNEGFTVVNGILRFFPTLKAYDLYLFMICLVPSFT